MSNEIVIKEDYWIALYQDCKVLYSSKYKTLYSDLTNEPTARWVYISDLLLKEKEKNILSIRLNSIDNKTEVVRTFSTDIWVLNRKGKSKQYNIGHHFKTSQGSKETKSLYYNNNDLETLLEDDWLGKQHLPKKIHYITFVVKLQSNIVFHIMVNDIIFPLKPEK